MDEAGAQQDIHIQGEALTELPDDLYIPPDALRVFLDAFEGPLDLLLYLIRKQNLDILDIPIAVITKQYIEYIDLMEEMHFELAAEYLVMAAMLAEIKSRMLLPKPNTEDEEEDDPRAELVRRLQEYERFKTAAQDIEGLPRWERELFAPETELPTFEQVIPEPSLTLEQLLFAFSDVLKRMEMSISHKVDFEPLSVRERMTGVLSQLGDRRFMPFVELFDPQEGKMGIVVSFLAILELSKESLIQIVQTKDYGPIFIAAVNASVADLEQDTQEVSLV